MKHLTKPLLAIFVLLLASLACQTVSGGGGEAPASGNGAGVLFQDDFSDPQSGWDQVRTADGITDYEDGIYRITVNTPNQDVWANPGKSFTDVHIEVEATKQGGPDDNDFGVICRYQNTDNFYFFIISSDGYYGIGKVQDGSQQLLGMENMEQSDAIYQGQASNRIAAECQGDQLTLWANGTKLFTIQDADFPSGDVGLMAGTFDTPGTDIAFDNFIVTQP